MVLYVDGKNKITDQQLALERGGKPNTMDGKTFYPPSCMRKTNSHDLREWKKWSLRRGEESKHGVVVVFLPANRCLN